MAEAAPNYAIQVDIKKVSTGNHGGSSQIRFVVGGADFAPKNVESPTVTTLAINDAQLLGLHGYIAMIKAGIDTAAVETAITTLVAAS